jgi:hypothetical protein
MAAAKHVKPSECHPAHVAPVLPKVPLSQLAHAHAYLHASPDRGATHMPRTHAHTLARTLARSLARSIAGPPAHTYIHTRTYTRAHAQAVHRCASRQE